MSGACCGLPEPVFSAVQRAARLLRLSTCGAESGAFVKSSKIGVRRPSPCNHQLKIRNARRAMPPRDGDSGAFGGRERSDGGAFVDTAQGWAERLISGTTVNLVAHERMNQTDNWEARANSVANRGPATIGVPAEDLAGEAQAAHSVRAPGKLHAAGWHLENVCSARYVEHVRPLEEARERLTVLAVADEAEASGRRNLARQSAYAAAPAPKREV